MKKIQKQFLEKYILRKKFGKKFVKKIFVEKSFSKKVFRKNLQKKFLLTLVEVSPSGLRWVEVEREWNFLTRVGWNWVRVVNDHLHTKQTGPNGLIFYGKLVHISKKIPLKFFFKFFHLEWWSKAPSKYKCNQNFNVALGPLITSVEDSNFNF